MQLLEVLDEQLIVNLGSTAMIARKIGSGGPKAYNYGLGFVFIIIYGFIDKLTMKTYAVTKVELPDYLP